MASKYQYKQAIPFLPSLDGQSGVIWISPREARPEPSHLVAAGPPLELQDPPVCGNYSFVVGKLQYEKEQELQWNGSSHSRDNSEAISTTRQVVS